MTNAFAYVSAALVLGTVVATGASCTSTGAPANDAGAAEDAGLAKDAGSAADAGGAPLKWYSTCGDPVCEAPADAGSNASGPDASSCAAVGTSCATKGETCGTSNPHIDCGAIEVCDDHDPTSLGCPVSSRKFKDDVEYLSPSDLEKLHDETIRMRLATYRYKPGIADPSSMHLGFIVEDAPQSLAVDRGHDRVDMYGYLSMVVATMQVQESEIVTLRRELDDARSGACSSKAPAQSKR